MSPKRPIVIVTDATARAVLAVCRGLGARGFAVACASASTVAPAQWSRYCSRRLILPTLESSAEHYVEELATLVEQDDYALLIPGTDQSLVTISAHRDRLEGHVRLALPSHATVLRALDKRQLAAAASAVGIPAPETAVCHSLEEALSAAERFGYPVLLKPRFVVSGLGDIVERYGSTRVEDPDELKLNASEIEAPYLVQRFAVGHVVSCAGVRAGKSTLALAVSRSIRNWPPGRGGWAFSITIEPTAGMIDVVERLVDELDWEGIFEVELIAHPDGSFSAIDLNPRPYGSLALAIAAGANLPAIWTEWVLRQSPQPVRARPGVYYRWEDADVRRCMKHLRLWQLRDAATIMRPRRKVVHAYFRRDDPSPFFARLLEGGHA